jgi:hypothetical protein
MKEGTTTRKPMIMMVNQLWLWILEDGESGVSAYLLSACRAYGLNPDPFYMKLMDIRPNLHMCASSKQVIGTGPIRLIRVLLPATPHP